MRASRYSQFCALARVADIIGERWTLLIMRELLLGPKRFGDLGERLKGVSPTLRTEHLNALIEFGVVRRATLAAPFNAQVYELTEVGRDSQPAIRELIRWGGHFLLPMRPDEVFEPDWVLLALDAIALRRPTPACRIVLRLRHHGGLANFVVAGGPAGTSIVKGEGPGGAAIETRFDTLLRMLAAELSIDAAIAAKQIEIKGALRIARKLPRLFDLEERRRGRRSAVS